MKLDVGKTARWMGTCACLVGGYEGLWMVAKPDTLAYNIPTVCYGETEGVKVGDHYTKQQCLDMLAAKLPRYWAEIAKCIKVPTSDNENIAYTSFSYNVGSGGFCKSTTLRKLNQGDHAGACHAMASWDRAGGKEVKGLQNRRASEIKICLTPDTPYVAKIADKFYPPVPFYPMPILPPPVAHTEAPAIEPATVMPPKTVVHKRHKLTVKEVVCTGMFWKRDCK